MNKFLTISHIWNKGQKEEKNLQFAIFQIFGNILKKSNMSTIFSLFGRITIFLSQRFFLLLIIC